jgi:hypothetical protein
METSAGGRRARRALVLTALVGGLLGFGAHPALAAYTAHVSTGTLRVTGDDASDKLALRLSPGAPQPSLGGSGNDFLLGEAGNDFVDGGRGNDTALLGSGDDTFQWDPGDSSDTVEGQGGNDTWKFDGRERLGADRDLRERHARPADARHRERGRPPSTRCGSRLTIQPDAAAAPTGAGSSLWIVSVARAHGQVRTPSMCVRSAWTV